MTNRDMERERERREWEQSELQDLEDLQAKHARIDERLEVSNRTGQIPAALTQALAALPPPHCLQPVQQLAPKDLNCCYCFRAALAILVALVGGVSNAAVAHG